MHIEKILIKLDICLFDKKSDKLLEKYKTNWEKGSSSIKKVFDSEPVYSERYLRTKIVSYKGKISTTFHDNKIPKDLSH